MNMQIKLALRYLAGRKLRTTLTTLAIVFGVLVIYGMNTMMPTFIRSFQSNVMAVYGQVDASISLKTGDFFAYSRLDEIRAIEGVEIAMPILSRTINLTPDYYDNDPDTADVYTVVSLVGLEPELASQMRAYQIKQGRFLEGNEHGVAVISESFADVIGVGLGDQVKFPSTEGELSMTVVGIQPPRTAGGNEEILVTLSQAQEAINQPGKISTIDANFVQVTDDERTALEEEILAVMGDTYTVGTLTANAELLTNLELANSIFSVLGGLALLMGGFIIFNTFRTIIAERRRDIGMLRAIGATRQTIFGVILFEGILQGVVGSVLGIVFGYLLGIMMISALGGIMSQYFNMQLTLPNPSPGLALLSMGLGIGVTLLAGLLPAMSASRLTPLEALRPSVSTFSFKRAFSWAFWVGIVLMGAALLALLTQDPGIAGLGAMLFIIGMVLAAPGLVNPLAFLFGRLMAILFARDGSAQLAEGNLNRQPGRAAITASATLISLAIIVMATSLVTSLTLGFTDALRKSLGSDYLLIPPSVAVWGGNVGASQELEDSLRAIPEVEYVSGLRFAPSSIGDTSISLLGIDPENYPKVGGLSFHTGDEATAYAALDSGDRKVIVNGILSSTIGKQVGDSLTLFTPQGEQEYTIVAIGNDYLNTKIPTAYIAHSRMAADFGREEDVLLQINILPDADPEAAEAAIKAVASDYPQFRFVNGQEYIEESLELFTAAFSAFYLMIVLLAIPSIIALVNTLTISVIERTREIGMLRAVGALRRQVQLTILAESLILAAIGTAFGLLTGLYLGYVLVQALGTLGFPISYLFPYSWVVVATAAGLLFGVVAAIIPARQAARLNVVEALRYE